MAVGTSDAVVSCPGGGTVTTVLAGGALTRVGGIVQNQSKDTAVMVRLGADPGAATGVPLAPLGIIQFGGGVPGNGNGTDFYQGDVRVWNPSPNAVNVYVLEATVP